MSNTDFLSPDDSVCCSSCDAMISVSEVSEAAGYCPACGTPIDFDFDDDEACDEQ